MWDDLVLVYFEGEVWKQEIEHLGFKAQYSNIYQKALKILFLQLQNRVENARQDITIIYSLKQPVSCPCGLYNKTFMIVFYYRNDSGLYYKTTIRANLASAIRINYDHKVRCILKHAFLSYLTIVDYNHKTIKV